MRNTIEEKLRPRYDYFEDKDVVHLQDETLLILNRHWSSYKGSFPLPKPDSEARQVFRDNLKKLIRKRFQKTNVWVVKDPRIGVLLSDWITVLHELKVKPLLIIVHRDPSNNVISFSQKGQVPKLWAESLWQRTYVNALETGNLLPSSDVTRASFEDLITKPEEETRRLCDFLEWPQKSNLSKIVQALFDPNLPTKEPHAGKSIELKTSTKQLRKILNNTTLPAVTPLEETLIAHQIEEKTNYKGQPLELNNIYINQKSLLPKVEIIIVTAEFQGCGGCGGIGSAYQEMAEALVDSGHRVKVLLIRSIDKSTFKNPYGLEIEQVDPTGMNRLEIARLIASKLIKSSADVIHLHDWLGFGSGLKQHLGTHGQKILIGLHGPSAWARTGNPWHRGTNGEHFINEDDLYEEGLIRALEKDSLVNADLLISPSSYMADWVKKNILNEKLSPSILVQRNCPLSEKFSRRGLNPQRKGEGKTIIYFGRLEARKGLLIFLEGLLQLKIPPSNVIFLGSDTTIHGKGFGTEIIRSKLRNIDFKYELKTNLLRKDALNLIHELDAVVVIPSIIENSPCVVEELLDTDLRLVVTNVGGTHEMIETSCKQWLAEPTPSSLAKHMEQALFSKNEMAYKLRAKIPSWEINLSWQAFHERMPRKASTLEVNQKINPIESRVSMKLILKKGLIFPKKLLLKIIHLLGLNQN